MTPTTGGPVSSGIPEITDVRMVGNNFIISGTNGPANADYHVLATADATLPIAQWTEIGSDVFDATGNFSTTNPVAPAAMNLVYKVRVGGVTPVAPAITAQPHDTTNLVGNTASFTVGASGTAPLYFQWYYNTNTPLAGKTGSTLTLTNVQFGDAGGYSVLVSNAVGSVTSVVAQLVVTNVATPP